MTFAHARPLVGALLVSTSLAIAAVAGSGGNDAATLPPAVQRFLSRTDEPLRSYRALRRLEARNPRYKKHGWLEAWTMLDPERGFIFEIVGEGGSSYVRDKVLRKALEREREAYSRSETGAGAIVPENYEFAEPHQDASGLVSVPLKPRRKHPLLLAGHLFLTAADADLVRLEGVLAKNPSFWTRRVHIVRRYGRLSDIRVPLSVESTAQIVMAGESSFAMQYEYASINGREVGQPQPRIVTANDTK